MILEREGSKAFTCQQIEIIAQRIASDKKRNVSLGVCGLHYIFLAHTEA